MLHALEQLRAAPAWATREARRHKILNKWDRKERDSREGEMEGGEEERKKGTERGEERRAVAPTSAPVMCLRNQSPTLLECHSREF